MFTISTQSRLTTVQHKNAIPIVGIGPKFAHPGQAGEKLVTVSFDSLKNLSVVSTNHQRKGIGAARETYRFARLMQLVAMLTILAIVRFSKAMGHEGLKGGKTGLSPVRKEKKTETRVPKSRDTSETTPVRNSYTLGDIQSCTASHCDG